MQGIASDWGPRTGVVKAPGIPRQGVQGLHHVLWGSGLADEMAHENDPNDRVGNMIIYSASYPLTCEPDDVLACQAYNRRYNYYCTDVQARGAYPSFAKRMLEELGVTLEAQPEDAEILKNGTVDFITFSYYMSSCQTAKDMKGGECNILGGVPNPNLSASDWGWQIDPKGLRYALNDLYDRHGQTPMVGEQRLGPQD